MPPDNEIDKRDLAAYHRWLLHQVLVEGRSTLWCAKEMEMDVRAVTRDFNWAVMHDGYFVHTKRK